MMHAEDIVGNRYIAMPSEDTEDFMCVLQYSDLQSVQIHETVIVICS
jgi:hypothetical protein